MAAVPPPKPVNGVSLSRSPGHRLLSVSPDGDVTASLSDSVNLSSSNTSTPSRYMQQPGNKRRSTDTASLDEYYFSSLAGVGASSSTSSLASPGPSNGMSFSNSPTHSAIDLSRGPSAQGTNDVNGKGAGDRSTTSLRGLINQEEESMSTSPHDYLSSVPRPPFSHQQSSDSQGPINPGPSNRRIHVVSYPSDQSVPQINPRHDSMDDERSPGGYSHSSASHYSSSELSSDNESFGFDVDGNPLKGLLGPGGGQDWSRSASRVEVRESVDSTFTVKDDHSTPMPPAQRDRLGLSPPTLQYPDPPRSPTSPNHNDQTPTLGGPVISSGRLAFVAPPDASQRSLNSLESEMKASESSERMAMVKNSEEPHSAPHTQTDFGVNFDEMDGEDTIKGRNRMTLPASASAAVFADMFATPDKDQEAPRRDSLTVRDAYASPNKSPQPPPRSTLRPHPSPALSRSSSEQPLEHPVPSETISPKSRNKALPNIITTDSSPQNQGHMARTTPARPDRSPTRSTDSVHSSTTINDLTEMLGGAIDAIGLIDSRDTPPPSIMEPRKDRGLSVPVLSAAAELVEPQGKTTLLPARGASLPGGSLGYDAHVARSQTQPMNGQGQDQGYGSSVHPAYGMNNITPGIPTARPWPAAMMYGNIKNLRNAGDRAKGYAKAINEISKAESGLREWCAASVQQANRPMTRPVKKSAITGLGVRPPNNALATPSTTSTSTTNTPNTLLLSEPTRARNVSTSSEFPMRADSYTAREISARMIDPLDQPTALPQNLPYPQLQQQFASHPASGMRASPSITSMASVNSKKSFFSAAIGRMGGKKESYSLGPPSGNYVPPTGMSTSKKDVRGLPISSPTYSLDGLPTHRVQGSISAPMGPRGPGQGPGSGQRGSYTPPPNINPDRNSVDIPSRASLDQGMARMAPPPLPARSSMDSSGPRKMSAPPKSSPMASQIPTFGSPGVKEEDVRQIADVLPHVERGVLRVYLAKYQEPMRAIGAYLEDEKRGATAR